MSIKRTLTLALGSLALIAVIVTIAVVLAAAFARLADVIGAGWFVRFKLHWAIAVIATLRLAIRGALPIRWRIVGSAVIDAPRDRIWALIVPTPGQPYHSNSVVRIEQIGDDPNHVILRFDDALANVGETEGPGLDTVIAEHEPGRRLLLRYQNAEILPLLGRDLEASEFLLGPDERGGHKVTFIEHMRAFRLWSMIVFLHLNPCDDAARRLKARCEGTEDTSWMGTTIDAIREDPTGNPDGLREFFVAAGIVLAGAVIGLSVFTPMLYRAISGQ